MSIRAYPVYEKEINGEYWYKRSSNDSFSLWGLTHDEESMLLDLNFYDSLNFDCCGVTCINIDTLNGFMQSLRIEERFRVKDLANLIFEDIKENGGYDIEYRCF